MENGKYLPLLKQCRGKDYRNKYMYRKGSDCLDIEDRGWVV